MNLTKLRSGRSFIPVAILLGIALIIVYFTVQFSATAIKGMPEHYYRLLPVANRADFDQDGIPDNIDDSDGDGIADAQDITPYGEELSILEMRTRKR